MEKKNNMGYYVHLSVTFSSSAEDINELRPIVEKHKQRYLDYQKLEEINDDLYDPKLSCNESIPFLNSLLDEKNYNSGHKGELYTWGIVGNYTRAEDFVYGLAPFFEEILKTETGPFDFDHIVVFYETEQSQQAYAYEIYLQGDQKLITIKHHPLPFCWNQF